MSSLFFKNKKENEKATRNDQVIEVTLEQVRQAIIVYADKLAPGISLRAIVLDDYSIDYDQLKTTLKGIPNRPFYMSKETFEIFETAELPKQIDHVQKAVDKYIQENGVEPIIPGNPYGEISYYLIRHYLSSELEVELYLDRNDKMVTHRRPE